MWMEKNVFIKKMFKLCTYAKLKWAKHVFIIRDWAKKRVQKESEKHWLSSKEKVPVAEVSKEGQVDSLLG